MISLVNPAKRRGNALVGVTCVVLDEALLRKLIQLPTKGTLVFNDIHHIALQAQRSGDHQEFVQELYSSLHSAWSSGTEYALVQSCAIIVQETITQSALISGSAQFCTQSIHACISPEDEKPNEEQ